MSDIGQEQRAWTTWVDHQCARMKRARARGFVGTLGVDLFALCSYKDLVPRRLSDKGPVKVKLIAPADVLTFLAPSERDQLGFLVSNKTRPRFEKRLKQLVDDALCYRLVGELCDGGYKVSTNDGAWDLAAERLHRSREAVVKSYYRTKRRLKNASAASSSFLHV